MQWSLRTFALLVVAIAAVLMVLSSWQREGQWHQHVAEKLQGQHVGIEWLHEDWQMVHPKPGVGVWRRASTVSPWVRKLGAEILFLRIERVTVNQKNAGQLEPVFEQLARLDHLPQLALHHSQATDDQLARWMAGTTIPELAAENSQLGRGRLPFLNHPTLTHLHLGRTQFSNPAIDDLPASLVHLNLRRTRVTDQGLSKFVRLKNLEELVLRRTPTSEAAIERLREQMPWCEIRWEPLTKP